MNAISQGTFPGQASAELAYSNPMNDILQRTFPKHQTKSEEATTNLPRWSPLDAGKGINGPAITFLHSGTWPGRNAQKHTLIPRSGRDFGVGSLRIPLDALMLTSLAETNSA